jgi:hypothetical protein
MLRATISGGAPPQTLDVTLTPINPPIIIPAGGGTFSFNASLTRLLGPMAPYVVWTRIKNPNGTYTGNILGPITINTPVGTTVTRTRNQNVPGTWAVGVYTYLGYVNDTFTYPAIDSSSFNFTKTPVAGTGTYVWDANCSGEPFPGEVVSNQPSTYGISCSPNPFNPTAAISYKLQAASIVSLRVFDSAGRLVVTLADGWQEAGSHQVAFDGSRLTSGLYFVRMQAGEFTAVQKLMLIK